MTIPSNSIPTLYAQFNDPSIVNSDELPLEANASNSPKPLNFDVRGMVVRELGTQLLVRVPRNRELLEQTIHKKWEQMDKLSAIAQDGLVQMLDETYPWPIFGSDYNSWIGSHTEVFDRRLDAISLAPSYARAAALRTLMSKVPNYLEWERFNHLLNAIPLVTPRSAQQRLLQDWVHAISNIEVVNMLGYNGLPIPIDEANVNIILAIFRQCSPKIQDSLLLHPNLAKLPAVLEKLKTYKAQDKGAI